MKTSVMDKLIGKYCKIVTKEPGEESAHVLFGTITDIDHDSGFVAIETNKGLGCININIIKAIKPRKKEEIIH